jgi:two-component system OmpR family response regulator
VCKPGFRQCADKSDAAILVLTARDELAHRVLGVETAAEDYLVKQFHYEELVARIRTVLAMQISGRSAREARFATREDPPYESARAQLKLARVLAALGDLDTSILELEQARSVFECLGAEPDVRSAQQTIERISRLTKV